MTSQHASPPDLVIVGGGIIGLATALSVAQRGLSVTVIEHTEPGKAATWAAAGMLSPLAEATHADGFLRFGLRSLRMYEHWLDGLATQWGHTIEFHRGGKLQLAHSGVDAEQLRRKEAWRHELGVRLEWWPADVLRARVPDLGAGILGGLFIEDDFRVDNRALGRALVDVVGRIGVTLNSGIGVKELRIAHGRVMGVTLNDGSTVDAGAVLVSAGAWSSQLQGLPRPLPIRPVRGQMLALQPESVPTDCVLESGVHYLVPRDDGRLLVGATVEDVGYRSFNTATGVRALLDAAMTLVPALKDASVVELWSGLRPATEDGRPVLGPDPDVEGLYYATGHFRNGILLAPATADVIGNLIDGGAVDGLPDSFRPGRFTEPSPNASHFGR